MEKIQMEKMNSFGTITDTILVVDKKNKYANHNYKYKTITPS